jgi:integrase/recombinase XerD
MKVDFDKIQVFRDRHGKWRYYTRISGLKRRPLPGNRQSKDGPHPSEFYTKYQEAVADAQTGIGTVEPGESLHKWPYGSAGWLITQYFGAPAFQRRPVSVQKKHRPHLEALRLKHGHRGVAKLDNETVEKLMLEKSATPSAANLFRNAVKDLMKYAVKLKLITANPAAEIEKLGSNNPHGHHTWTEEEMGQFRAHHKVGTKARLALELLHTLALRRSDAVRLGPGHVRKDVVINGVRMDVVDYIQYKNRERKPSRVVVQMPDDLAAVIAATPVTGAKTWLVTRKGTPFTDDYLTEWFAVQVKDAGLPDVCTPHGVRKRSCTDLAHSGVTTQEGMAISGHRSDSEWQRYTKGAERERLAAAGMAKRWAAAEQKKSQTRG